MRELGRNYWVLFFFVAETNAQIEKECRIQKRVLWQNRVWSLIGGLGIGIVVGG
jgi:hypothetical protein